MPWFRCISGRSRRKVKWWFSRAVIILLLIGGLGHVLFRSITPCDFRFQRVAWPTRSRWIAAEGKENYSGFFRKEIFINKRVAVAWMQIAPHESFELTINGNSVSRWNLWRPTRCYQNGMSAFGQRIQTRRATLGLNYPREYQWEGHRNAALPVMVDIGPWLRKGTNVICFQISSRKAPAAIRFTGAIEFVTGEKMSLHSDASYRACSFPRNVSLRKWCGYITCKLDWPAAVELSDQNTSASQIRYLNRPSWTHVPGGGFTVPFQGKWIFSPRREWETAGNRSDSRRPVDYYFETEWTIPGKPSQAYIRVLANRPFYVFVNGNWVDPCVPHSKERTGGEWLINAVIPTPRGRPEILDPDEVGSLFVGTRFESPRHGDPTINDFKRFRNTMNRTDDRPFQRGELKDDDADRQKSGNVDRFLKSPIEAPDRLIPRSLTRNTAKVEFKIYGIANLLHSGRNRIVIRAVDHPVADSVQLGAPRVAADLGATVHGSLYSDRTASHWKIRVGDLNRPSSPAGDYVAPSKLPEAVFWGHARIRASHIRWVRALALVVSACFYGAWYWILRALGFRPLFHVYQLIPSLLITLGAVMLHIAFRENSELIYFLFPQTWRYVAITAMMVPVLGVWRIVSLRRRRQSRSANPAPSGCDTASASLSPRHALARRTAYGAALRIQSVRAAVRRVGRWPIVRRLIGKPDLGWAALVYLIVLACGILRAYELDFQTLDDDEYASVQAALSIAETGTPHLVGNIYYTRSPLHHYYAGALAWLFGGNIWVLRMGQVVLAMGTCWLSYLCGSKILGSRWSGIGAMLIYSMHPFLIHVGHVARFYQQQQFFALLLLYWFYWGFVAETHPRYRYLTLLAFLAALLSQETSAVLGLSMAVCFLVFCVHIKSSGIIKCGIVAACVVGLLAVDFLAFQANCLTRTEGVSPNVEAVVKPNFTCMLNLFSVFITYARLHVVMSTFVVLGVVIAIYQKNRETLYLALMCGTGILYAVTFITGVSLRYQLWVFAPWIVLSVHGIQKLVVVLKDTYRIPRDAIVRPAAYAVALTLLVIASLAPWRIPGSYQTKLLGNATGALRWVRANMRPDDAVATTEPHPHAARIEAHESTFDISFPLLYDFTYKDPQGYLRDRNANALVIASMADIQWATANYDRIWFCVNREKFRSAHRNLRWEYPSARAELFFRDNCLLMHQNYLWSVFLWDKNTGHFNAFRRELQ